MFSRRSTVLLNLFKRHISSQHENCQEVRIPVPWGSLAGKWWGPQDQRPVLCLHGWQDNCGTFDRLIPLLKKDVAFLAVDFPGHGYSDSLPSGMFYHPSVYFLCVNTLAKYFKWDSVYLMGHSLGGVAALTHCMCCPDQVDFLIGLDASIPLRLKQDPADTTNEIRKFLKYDAMQASEEEPPSYTFEEIKERVAQGQNKSIKIEHSPLIALRNIKESIKCPGKFYFSRDARLKAVPSFDWEKKYLVNSAQHMKFPMLMMKALSSSSTDEPKEKFYEVMDEIAKINTDFHLCKLEGTHHLHLNDPEPLSSEINRFLEKYYQVDKSKGGIREEIIHDEELEEMDVKLVAKL